jgi:hypothetical protein
MAEFCAYCGTCGGKYGVGIALRIMLQLNASGKIQSEMGTIPYLTQKTPGA